MDRSEIICATDVVINIFQMNNLTQLLGILSDITIALTLYLALIAKDEKKIKQKRIATYALIALSIFGFAAILATF